MTAEDIPGTQKVGHLKRDWDVIVSVGKTTHYLGDAVALCRRRDPGNTGKSKKAIKVEYKPLDGVFSPVEAMKDGAPLVHEDGNLLSEEHLVRGDAEKVISESRYSVTNHYSLPFTEHAFMETECAVAFPEDGGIHIISGDQGIYQTQRECSDALGLPPEKGQGVGGHGRRRLRRQGRYERSAPCRSACPKNRPPGQSKADKTGKHTVHPKRHAMEIDLTTACDENGKLTAMKAVIISGHGSVRQPRRSVASKSLHPCRLPL